jgi:DNA invertase Pin-like site-specific DNA recombinase
MFMPHHTKQRQARRRAPLQIDLFAEARQKAIGGMPAWSGLPGETQATLTALMTRLLVDHADKNRSDSMTETVMITDKVRPHHLERKALLYVRQSSAQQVLHNRERDRLAALGWSEIEVIDDDLGRSAAGSVQRAGFERMVAEVCLGKVGAVAAREVSRFARNSRDWQQLIEMCRVVDTVLIDQETVYAPRHGNDRLLLGLKGSLNEYELDLLRQRSLAARYEKAGGVNSWSARRWASSRPATAMRRTRIAACRRPSASCSIKCWSSAAPGRLCSGSTSTISICR